jgi:TRAP-type uncharacterized transport system substrate-binding protein
LRLEERRHDGEGGPSRGPEGEAPNFLRRKAMAKPKLKCALMIVAATLAGTLALSAQQSADVSAPQRKTLRWATSPVGSYGNTVAASITKIVERALGDEYFAAVNPYPSTTVAMRMAMDGYAEIAYTADIGMSQFQQRVGGFNNYKPAKAEIAHTWYAYPMESMMATLASHAGRFKCWRDFSDQPVFYSNAGFMHWLNWQRVFDILGYKLRHVQIDLQSNTRSLQAGTIVGSAIYTTAGDSLPLYWRQTESRLDITIVNPCPDEIAKLGAAGLGIVDVDPTRAFAKGVGHSVLKGVPILFGFNARLDIPEGAIYKVISTLHAEKDNLAKANPAFTPLATDFIGMQVQGISANPDIAVHPGLARFLKEHSSWNERWKLAARTN